MNYCGMDISTNSIAICIIDQQGQLLWNGSSGFDKAELRSKLSGFEQLQCVVEATALSDSFCLLVEEIGHKIEVIDPRQAKAVTQTKKKTDKIDAIKLAQLARTGWYVRVHRKSGYSRDIRTYLTARMNLVRSAGSLSNSILGLLKAHGIRLTKSSNSKGFAEEVLLAIKEQSEILQAAINPLLEAWQLLHKQEQAMYRELKKFLKNNELISRLMTVPGVGIATAAAFASTIDNSSRFKSTDRVASYLGLVPSIYQSGEMEYRGRITKQGDPLLRWLLVESATVLLTRVSSSFPLRTWGMKIAEQKGFAKARVAVARKLACLLFSLWKKNAVFTLN